MTKVGVLLTVGAIVAATAVQAQVNGVGDARAQSLPAGDVIGIARSGAGPGSGTFDADRGPFSSRPLYQGRAVRRSPSR